MILQSRCHQCNGSNWYLPASRSSLIHRATVTGAQLPCRTPLRSWTALAIRLIRCVCGRTALRCVLRRPQELSILCLQSPQPRRCFESAHRGSGEATTAATKRAEWGSREPKESTAKMSGPVVCLVPCSLRTVLSMFSGSITPRQGTA